MRGWFAIAFGVVVARRAIARMAECRLRLQEDTYLGRLIDARVIDREFGLDGVKLVLVEMAERPLPEIRDGLRSRIAQHGRQLDDQTILLIRRLHPVLPIAFEQPSRRRRVADE